jgi:Flp pilus assembly secretin CpaC
MPAGVVAGHNGNKSGTGASDVSTNADTLQAVQNLTEAVPMATKRSDRKVMLSVRVPEWSREELREIAAQEVRRLSEQLTRVLREFLPGL